MPKRKRDDGAPGPKEGRAKRGRRDDLLQSAVANTQKQLHQAFKLAKGFERQKLSRRQKRCRQDGDTTNLARVEAEIKACKILEPETLARTHLLRLVEREKSLRASEILLSLCQTVKRTVNDSATLNVTARLYKSNPVSSAVAKCIPQIKQALGIDNPDKTRTNSKTSSRGVKNADIQSNLESDSAEDTEGDHTSIDNGSESEIESRSDTGSRIRDPQAMGDIDLATDDEAGFDEVEQRMLGSDSDSGSSIDFESLKASAGPHRTRELSVTPYDTDSDEPDESAEDTQSEDDKRLPATGMTRKLGKKGSGESAFLPSLAMGGYISGSESEASEIEEVAPRKNRRGQRARQQIWEKKFKDQAKHLQDGGNDANRNRAKGWDPKRGATKWSSKDGKGSWKPGQGRGREKKERAQYASSANAVQLGGRKLPVKDDKPLHPSWAAKIKAKEKGDGGTAAFAGTKMTFD